jgi:F0F1-type ATP synthase assembly protein I
VTERDDKSWLRLAGLGFELAASIVGGVAIGWWIDRQLGTSPKATVGLGLIGLFGGMYNLIKTALRSGDR